MSIGVNFLSDVVWRREIALGIGGPEAEVRISVC